MNPPSGFHSLQTVEQQSAGYEYFGSFVVAINGPWVLDFAIDGWRTVFTGPQRIIKAAFKSWFGSEMVSVWTRRGPQTKINPESGHVLLGYGPLMEDDYLHANRLAQRTKKRGGWFEQELADVVFLRRLAAAHQRDGGTMDVEEWLGTKAPRHWLETWQAIQTRQAARVRH